jgi:hypothetical protein
MTINLDQEIMENEKASTLVSAPLTQILGRSHQHLGGLQLLGLPTPQENVGAKQPYQTPTIAQILNLKLLILSKELHL